MTTEFLGHNSSSSSQWSAYRHLELLSESVPDAHSPRLRFAFGVDRVWQLLIALLIDELIDEQQVEYLDRCWALNEHGAGKTPSSTLRRLWDLMN